MTISDGITGSARQNPAGAVTVTPELLTYVAGVTMRSPSE